MKILLVAGDLPRWTHGVRAVDLVLSSLIDEFRGMGHDIVFQLIARGAVPADAEDARGALEKRGITVLPWLAADDYRATTLPERLRRAIDRRVKNQRFFYPSLALCAEMERRSREHRPDCALLFWVPEAVAATTSLRIPRLAYYGMPDHAAHEAQFAVPELFDITLPESALARERHAVALHERAHLDLFKQCTVMANLSADHAAYYKEKGHPDAVYVQNTWPGADLAPVDHHALQGSKLKICGSVGRPAATGNTFGLHFLGSELLPRLDSALGKDNYEMHIFGKGEPYSRVKKALDHPAVRMRGWVADIDSEIRSCHLFLVANNAVPHYRGSHTRFLHAWTMRACCVGHAYNLKANPEMEHDHNVLLGETADEMVAHIVRAAGDADLRKRIGDAGYETYAEFFTPPTVARSLLAHLERITA